MVNTTELKILMIRKHMNYGDMAKQLGLSCATFTRRMQTGVFKSDEMEAMIDVLGIKDPNRIFFANEVT